MPIRSDLKAARIASGGFLHLECFLSAGRKLSHNVMNLIPDTHIAVQLALRARFGSIALWLMALLCVTVWMSAQFSGRQPATVALDVGLSVIRLGLPLLAVLLAQELICHEFLRRNFLSSMTYPRARYRFLMGRFLAIALMMLTLLLALALILTGLVIMITYGYNQSTPIALDHHFATVIAFIGLDLLVVLSVSTLIAVSASTPSFVLVGSLGFMLAARSYAPIVTLLTRDTTLVDNANAYQSSLNLLGYLLPDLAALDIRMIAIYGQWQFLPEDWLMSVTGSLAYVTAILGLAVWSLNRKKFA